jgi:hypothetical protein
MLIGQADQPRVRENRWIEPKKSPDKIFCEKNTIQQFFSFDPAILAFPLQIPIRYSPRTTSAYSLGSNFSRLKGVPAGVRALLESRERHKRRRRTQRIYSNDHDESIQSKISHRSL